MAFQPFQGFLKGVAGGLIIRLSATGLGFVTTWLIARHWGAEVLGAYTFALTWVTLLAVLAGLGLTTLVTRTTAVERSREADCPGGALLLFAVRASFVASVPLMSIVMLLAQWMARGEDIALWRGLWAALPLVPLVALLQIFQAAARGWGRAVLGQVAELFLRPLGFLVVVAAAVFYGATQAGVELLFLGQIGATGAAVIVAIVIVRAIGSGKLFGRPQAGEGRAWLTEARPFFASTLLYALSTQIDTMLLGALGGAQELGFYTIAWRLAALIGFSLFASNAVLAPRFASLHAQGQRLEIARLARSAAVLTSLVALPVAGVYGFFGAPVLGLFGADFVGAQPVLLILAAGQLFNVVTGPVGLVLNMVGQERAVVRALSVSVAVNVILNLVLIPRWGGVGAAVASTAGFVVWNVLLLRVLRRWFQADPPAIA